MSDNVDLAFDPYNALFPSIDVTVGSRKFGILSFPASCLNCTYLHGSMSRRIRKWLLHCSVKYVDTAALDRVDSCQSGLGSN